MDVGNFADEVFKSDARILYVGIVDNELHVLISKMRDGAPNLTSDTSDRNYLQIAPNILVETAEKLSPVLGRVESVTIRYEKLFMVFFRLENLTIVLKFEPNIVRPFMLSIEHDADTWFPLPQITNHPAAPASSTQAPLSRLTGCN